MWRARADAPMETLTAEAASAAPPIAAPCASPGLFRSCFGCMWLGFKVNAVLLALIIIAVIAAVLFVWKKYLKGDKSFFKTPLKCIVQRGAAIALKRDDALKIGAISLSRRPLALTMTKIELTNPATPSGLDAWQNPNFLNVGKLHVDLGDLKDALSLVGVRQREKWILGCLAGRFHALHVHDVELVIEEVLGADDERGGSKGKTSNLQLLTGFKDLDSIKAAARPDPTPQELAATIIMQKFHRGQRERENLEKKGMTVKASARPPPEPPALTPTKSRKSFMEYIIPHKVKDASSKAINKAADAHSVAKGAAVAGVQGATAVAAVGADVGVSAAKKGVALTKDGVDMCVKATGSVLNAGYGVMSRAAGVPQTPGAPGIQMHAQPHGDLLRADAPPVSRGATAWRGCVCC